MNSIKIVRASSLLTSNWSGGTTTQIAISPEDGNYAERQFDWRISTATVEVEQSEFTPLPGVTRFITSLEGQLALEHEGHHHVVLEPYDVDCFKGDWKTTSFGRVTDFNLMLKNGFSGELRSVFVPASEAVNVGFEAVEGIETEMILGIYAASNALRCTAGADSYNLEKGDLLLLDSARDGSEQVTVSADVPCHICVVEVVKL